MSGDKEIVVGQVLPSCTRVWRGFSRVLVMGAWPTLGELTFREMIEEFFLCTVISLRWNIC